MPKRRVILQRSPSPASLPAGQNLSSSLCEMPLVAPISFALLALSSFPVLFLLLSRFDLPFVSNPTPSQMPAQFRWTYHHSISVPYASPARSQQIARPDLPSVLSGAGDGLDGIYVRTARTASFFTSSSKAIATAVPMGSPYRITKGHGAPKVARPD